MRIVFMLRELGIGGAERLAIDAALALKRNGHEVRLLVPRHSSAQAFPETCDQTIEVKGQQAEVAFAA